MNEDKDLFEETVKEVEELVDNPNFIWIKQGDQAIRLFKSLENRRLKEFEETFGEYKVRQKINNKLINKHKKGVLGSNI